MEQLTEDDVKWKGNEYYEAQKDILKSPKYANAWRNIYSKRNVSGPCMETCNKLKPVSCEDFYERAVSICQKLSKENMERIAVKWRDYCNEYDIPLRTFYDVVVCHNIVETFKGQENEMKVVSMLRDNGFEIVPTTDDDDSMRGIDIIARKNGKTYFIQVKVISYLYGGKPDLVADRQKVFTEYIPNQRETYGDGIPYVWVFYDYKTKEWVWNSENNSFQWDITKILEKKGYCMLKEEYRNYFKNPSNRRVSLN